MWRVSKGSGASPMHPTAIKGLKDQADIRAALEAELAAIADELKKDPELINR